MPQSAEELGPRLQAICEHYCPLSDVCEPAAREHGLAVSCTQGNKKLDKAEILEMTIEYIQRLHQGGAGGGRASGQLDLALGQKEWATDLTTWVIQNKILHTGGSPSLPPPCFNCH